MINKLSWVPFSVELSRYVQSEIPQNLRFEENALDLRSGA